MNETSCKLPLKGEVLAIKRDGKTLMIRKTKSGRGWVLKSGSRVRFGNRAEAHEDLEHFMEFGSLPPKGRMLF